MPSRDGRGEQDRLSGGRRVRNADDACRRRALVDDLVGRLPVLVAKVTSPLYTALIAWLATLRLAVTRVAVAPATATGVPRLVTPSLN